MKVKDLISNNSVWMPGKDYEKAKPCVSILLPTFKRNENGLFRKAVESVLDQSMKDIEVIIIDDCSYDGTFETIKDLMKKDGRVSCIRHTKNMGVVAISEYEAYCHSKGDYIAFMFDDNEWEAGALLATVEMMKGAGYKATYGVSRFASDKRTTLSLLGEVGIDQYSLETTNFVGNGSVVIHRDIIEEVGWFDPHLVLTRLCDWDLWIRIARITDFVATGILFTVEKGGTQDDSLGNSYPMDACSSREYMQQDRNIQLRPGAYMDFDIIDISETSSKQLSAYMRESISHFTKKPWFDYEDPSYKHLMSDACDGIDKKRVMVLTADLTASEALYFGRIPKNDDCIISFYWLGGFSYRQLADSDVLIVSRLLDFSIRIVSFARNLGIPVYYYTDDNFTRLYEEGYRAPGIEKTVNLMDKGYLDQFRGVIVSSPVLRDFFIQEGYHDNVIVLDPCSWLDAAVEPSRSAADGRLAVAFLGGKFREKALREYVIPALKGIDNRPPVDFYIPDDDELQLGDYEDDTFVIHRIERSKNVNLLLRNYGFHGIDIQVHPAVNSDNNKYKTKNALLNATQLGAVLIATDVEPFLASDEEADAYITAENTLDSWRKAFCKALDSENREKVYRHAKALCDGRYSPAVAPRQFLDEMKGIENERTGLSLCPADVSFTTIPGHIEKRIESSFICQTEPLKESRRFAVRFRAGRLIGIGLLFSGVNWEPNMVKVVIDFDDAKSIESSQSMADVRYGMWTYFLLPPTDVVEDCIASINLTVEYTFGGYPISVYIEDPSLEANGIAFAISDDFFICVDAVYD